MEAVSLSLAFALVVGEVAGYADDEGAMHAPDDFVEGVGKGEVAAVEVSVLRDQVARRWRTPRQQLSEVLAWDPLDVPRIEIGVVGQPERGLLPS